MVFSQEKPKEIYIISTNSDIKTGRFKVKYAFRYNIQQVSRTETYVDEAGVEQTQTIEGWEYEEYINEQEYDLFLRPSIVDILKSLYNSIVPVLQYSQNYANIEIPKEIEVNDNGTA
jgi:saccharopine dehydrogenase-like NADP-dependent oxidoreductase